MEAHPTRGQGWRTGRGACLPAPALHLVGSLGISGGRGGVVGGIHCTPNLSFPGCSSGTYTPPSCSLCSVSEIHPRSHLKVCPTPQSAPAASPVPSSSCLSVDDALSLHHCHWPRQPPSLAWIPAAPANGSPFLQFYPLPIHCLYD